ncbi:antibiotic biosynthesis monooxygenase family protein [Maribacter hydrothermalis]|uniref:JEMB protein n=1 Tax=Maribacter hydrothermalis TaxID=1836467 RepID=A0A1B7Z3X5_9FLAO|nr:antibiotic biosynthesis monooxygenase [Maribacter hydrothermalis]APQ17152.1 antibiotic biosynthesis monooxygenase [Maribacter hydrothermalis]OBR37413.1 JEMB protein [Maribacter hydrothermalis]
MTTPYYAVIFTSTRTIGDNGYGKIAEFMEQLAKKQPGFIGIESARQQIGITVSYWESINAIQDWKQQADHLLAQKEGIANWYDSYTVRICLVEREYSFNRTS